jgi:hypothetical protein
MKQTFLIISLVLLTSAYGCGDNTKESNLAVSGDKKLKIDSEPTKINKHEDWTYSQDTDKMTSNVVRYAVSTAKNEIEFSAPYNGGS